QGSGGQEGGSHEIAVASAAAPEISTSQFTTTSGAAIPWGTIALAAWAAGAALVLGRMFLGLAAVLWLSRRTPVVSDAPWSAQAQRSQLEGRLMAILDPSVPRRVLSRARAFAAAVVFALIVVPVASVQPWAEERAAVNDADVEMTAAPQASAPAQKPIESYPGQADADNRRDARQQDVIQGQVQGQLQGQLQGAIQAGLQGVVSGVQPGVVGEIGAALGQTIGTAVGQAVGAGLSAGLGAAMDGIHERVVEHDAQDKDQDRDEPRKGRGMDPRAV